MKSRLLIFFTILPLSVFAQQSYLGVKGGVNWSNYSSSGISHDFRTSFNAGITYEYKIGNGISVSGDLLYSQRGFRDKVALRDESNQSLGTAIFRSNLNYISLPLKFGYTLGKTVYAFGNLGIVPAYLVHARERSDGTSALGPVDENIKPSRFDLGGLVELGGGYSLTHFSIYVSLAAQRSVTSASGDFYPNANLHYYGYSLSAGIKYKLKAQ